MSHRTEGNPEFSYALSMWCGIFPKHGTKAANAILARTATASARRCLTLADQLAGFSDFDSNKEVRLIYVLALVNAIAAGDYQVARQALARAARVAEWHEMARLSEAAARALAHTSSQCADPAVGRLFALLMQELPGFRQRTSLHQMMARSHVELAARCDTVFCLILLEDLVPLLGQDELYAFAVARLLVRATLAADSPAEWRALEQASQHLDGRSHRIDQALLLVRQRAASTASTSFKVTTSY